MRYPSKFAALAASFGVAAGATSYEAMGLWSEGNRESARTAQLEEAHDHAEISGWSRLILSVEVAGLALALTLETRMIARQAAVEEE